MYNAFQITKPCLETSVTSDLPKTQVNYEIEEITTVIFIFYPGKTFIFQISVIFAYSSMLYCPATYSSKFGKKRGISQSQTYISLLLHSTVCSSQGADATIKTSVFKGILKGSIKFCSRTKLTVQGY